MARVGGGVGGAVLEHMYGYLRFASDCVYRVSVALFSSMLMLAKNLDC